MPFRNRYTGLIERYRDRLPVSADTRIIKCTDELILATQKLLAEKEGIFCEPASAASVAGALRDVKSGKIAEGSSIVCTLTGHGLKDPDTAIKQSTAEVLTVDAELEAVKRAIFGKTA